MHRTLLLICAALLACGDGNPQPAVVIDTLPGGIVRIIGSMPEHPVTENWSLELERTIQPPDNSPFELGSVELIALTSNGDVIAAEGPLNAQRLIRFPAAATDSGVLIAATGEGPGEVSQPRISIFGDSLVVTDGNRIMTFNNDGKLRNQRLLPRPGAHAVDSEGRAWFAARRQDVREASPNPFTGMIWLAYPPDGGIPDSLPFPVVTLPGQWNLPRSTFFVPFSPTTVHRILPNGTIVYGGTDRDEYLVSRNGRDTVMIFGRADAVPVPIAEADRKMEFDSRIEYSAELSGIASLSDVPTHYELWNSIAVDEQANYWVRRYSAPSTQGAVYDIYSADGNYLGPFELPSRSYFVAWGAGRVALADADENDFPQIRVYRVVR